LLLILALLPAAPVAARTGGNLLVLPSRLVFEGRDRSAEVTLINQGTAPAQYRVSVVEMRMTEQGGLEQATELRSDERSARDLFVYSPRQVRLEPGEAQTVRLQVRKPHDLEPGEYRSHLRFRLIPPPGATNAVEPNEGGEAIGIELTPIFNVVIPVIVRHGELSGRAEIAGAELERPDGGPPTVVVGFERRGRASVYGDLRIDYLPEGEGDSAEAIQVALQRGLALYTPNRRRSVDVPLALPDGVELGSGTLRITYRARPERAAGERPEDAPLLARTDLPLS
jgi:P pilus assembly chaperone PapD